MSTIDDIPAKYLPCRDYTHNWDPYDAQIDKRAKRIVRTLRCSRCGTERDHILHMTTGEIIGSRYRYPQGYVIPHLGYLTKADRGAIRLMNLFGKK